MKSYSPADYDCWIDELRDCVWAQLNSANGVMYGACISGQKQYGGTIRRVFVGDCEADGAELILLIGSNNTRDTLRAQLWAAFRREPIISLLNEMPAICPVVLVDTGNNATVGAYHPARNGL